jgi:hypothetical protein
MREREITFEALDRRIDCKNTRYETSCALTMTSRPFGLTLRLYISLDMGLRISIKRAGSEKGVHFYLSRLERGNEPNASSSSLPPGPSPRLP